MKSKVILFLTVFFIVVSLSILLICMNITPIELKKDTFVYEYGLSEISTNIEDYVIANEFVMEQSILHLDEVSNDIGVYMAYVEYNNKSFPFFIKVVDTIKPVAKLKEIEVYIEVDTTIVASDLVDLIKDNSSTTVYFIQDGNYIEDKLYIVSGTYIENIVVVDTSNNSSATLRVKILVGKKEHYPILNGCNDVVIKQHEHFNPYLNVTGEDGLGNDISSRIHIIKNTVDSSTKGIYEVVYSLTNADGNTIQETRKVTVE